MTLGGSPAEWVTPGSFASSAAPAFRTKAGRTVVLALSNRGDIAEVYHLHGHHFRLLDRLDDGWKPFWLDTLAIEPGQTQRIALSAEYAGRWLMETMATSWAAPHLAGIAARILSLRPGLKPFEMKALLYWVFRASRQKP